VNAIAPKAAQLVIDKIFQVHRDLDRARSMAKEFLRATPIERKHAQVKPNPASNSDLIRHAEAVQLLCGRGVLDRCKRAGWIRAVVRQKRLTLYRRVDVLAAVEKLLAGDLP
jgi:hypothetical protein